MAAVDTRPAASAAPRRVIAGGDPGSRTHRSATSSERSLILAGGG